jgi:F-type H+-transporting ATPase subunit b
MLALLQVAPAADGQVAQIAKTFGVDWTHLVSQIISFSIVCAILYAFAYRRILKMLDERRTQIATGLANAEKIRVELERIEVQRREILAAASEQGMKALDDARMAAAQVKEQEIRKAVATGEQILTKAKEAAQQEHAQMLADLKHELGRLVALATTTVTGKILTPEDQRRLVEETNRQIAA